MRRIKNSFHRLIATLIFVTIEDFRKAQEKSNNYYNKHVKENPSEK
jgi:hypothetical protein